MDEIFEFLKKNHVYYLATCENGQPRVRAFGTSDLFEGKLYIQTGLSKDCAKQMIANPKVEICCFDPAAGCWLRIEADAVHEANPAAEQHMLDNHESLKNRYAVGDGNMAVFRIDVKHAYIDSFGQPRKTIK